MRLRLLSPALVVSALALSACGGGGDSSGTTAPTDADVVVSAIEGVKWDAGQYSAAAGEVTIAVTNNSSLPHNLHVIDAGGTDLGMKLNIPSRGDVASGTLTLPAGTYTLICTIAGHGGMKSTLTIT